jgi:hypothetical protein
MCGALFGVVVGRVVDGAGKGVVGVVERCGWGGRELLGADVSWFGLCEVLGGDGVVVVTRDRPVVVVDHDRTAGLLHHRGGLDEVGDAHHRASSS